MGKNIALLAVILVMVLGPIILRPRGDEAALRGQDALIVITPHNEAIRSEFGEAFREWYRRKKGRTVLVDWRTPGGTSEIIRYLESSYNTAFENHWKRELRRPWTNEVQQGFMDSKTKPAASPSDDTPREAARRAFLASNVSSGIDVFFGGGSYDFQKEAAAGLLTDCGYVKAHPELFGIGKPIPPIVGGERYFDEGGQWMGTTLGAFGIASNRDQLARLGLSPPHTWSDLADPRYFRAIALANPTQSSASGKAFEMLIQQQMNLTDAERGTKDAANTAEGWARGMRLIQRISANARYFTDSSAKIALDIDAGEAAAGMTIDFYGRFQSETVRRADGSSRVTYVDAAGGTSYGVDPIGLLRGAPHPELARAFIEFVMSDGQKLWGFRAGAPGGPRRHSLRRLPLLPELYSEAHRALRTDPDVLPYEAAKDFAYDSKRTGPLFTTISFIIRVMCIDPHRELTAAWGALCEAKNRTGGFPREALSAFADVAHVDYAMASGRIRSTLSEGKGKIEQVRLAKELADRFRANYQRAEALARSGR
ncbi:MAG: extracellular solute-binding protein [Chthoniobacteraceae bacterium]